MYIFSCHYHQKILICPINPIYARSSSNVKVSAKPEDAQSFFQIPINQFTGGDELEDVSTQTDNR